MKLIDANALKSRLKKQDARTFAIEELNLLVDFAPAIDAVPVIRCKDCKHWNEHSQYGYDDERGTYGNYCMIWTPDDDFYAVETPADGFCFEAERKDNEQEMPIHKSR